MTRDLVTLSEPWTDSVARVLPGLGFNCFAFQTRRDGEIMDVLWAPPEFIGGKTSPSAGGIPLLFPFAGRIGGAAFEYEGRRYQLERQDGLGNAIHGFVLRRRWRVIEQTASRVVGQFHAGRDDSALLDRWPADFRITVSYELCDGTLVSEIDIDNPDDKPLPFGFGTHAYFRAPPTTPRDTSPWRVAVPTKRQWGLDAMLPTGARFSTGVEERLRRGMPFDECRFDHVFTDLDFDEGRCVTRLYHESTERAITQTFDEGFRHCVVYTPRHREAICMEPYTALPDCFKMAGAFHMPAVPRADRADYLAAGPRVLPPGEHWRGRIVIAPR